MSKVSWVLAILVVVALTASGLYWHLSGPAATPDETGTPDLARATPAVFFRDRAEESGVSFTYRNGQEADHYAILESLGGGAGVLDYDGDGLPDLFLTGGGYFDGPDRKQIKGHPSRLYKNLGGWQFRDVTAEAGLDAPLFYTHGCAAADYDRDGWTDLLVTGWGRLALFHNESDGNGGRRFREVSQAAGLQRGPVWTTSAAWGDLDGDGWPDLYVCQYVNWSFDNHPPCEGYSTDIPRDVCPPKQFDALLHLLYRNNGDSTFAEVGKEAGLRMRRATADYDGLTHLSEKSRERLRRGDFERDFGKGLGVVLVDVNGDGRPDVCVANDTTDRFLYVNRSRPGQVRLEEQGFELGVAVDDQGLPNGSMGVDAGDYDGSGRASLLVTNFENELHGLYRNVLADGRLAFEYSTHAAGMASLGRQYVGFGTGFCDLDGDGWEDVFIMNGHVIRHPKRATVRQRPVLLRNQGRAAGQKRVQFANMTAQGGAYFQADHQGRGAAVADLDNDGRPDLVVSHLNEPVAVLSNAWDDGHHWLGVELAGKDHRDVVGARLTLQVGDRVLTRFARGGGSYLSSGDRRQLFGLGKAEQVGRLTVVWPSGEEQHWDGLAIDRYWRLEAGRTEAQRVRTGAVE